MRNARRVLAVLALSPLAACAASDDSPPTLELQTPERGTLVQGTAVIVTGVATDDAPERLTVTVNGVAAPVAPDGSFSATIEAPPGITIVETLVTDGGGNQVRDVRAVLGGTLAPADGAVADAVGVHIGPDGFTALGQVIGTTVEGMDLTAAVAARNPVFVDDGCLGAVVDVTRVAVTGVDVALVPGPAIVTTGVTITGLEVDLDVDYEVACVGGNADIQVTADAVRIGGNLGLDVLDGDLRSSLRDATVTIEGFDMEAGGLTGAVVDLLQGRIDDAIADALVDVLQNEVPALADDALADLTTKAYTVSALDRELAVRVAPTDVDLEATGAFVAVDASIRVAGGEGGAYLSTPSPVSAAIMDEPRGLGLAVADDLLNQLFGGLWGSGALDLSMPLEQGNPLGLLLDAQTRSIDVEMALPPTVSSGDGGDLHVAIGDLVLRCRDEAGEELSRIAISMKTTIGAESIDGAMKLRLGPPQVWAQVIWQSDRLEHPMDGRQVEGLVTAVWDLIGPMADQALAGVPLPSVAGVTVRDPSFASASGFLVLQAALAAAP